MVNFEEFDISEYLDNPETISFFLADAFSTGDVSYISKCLGDVAKAKGMAQISAESGLSRESLYKAFSENGNPTLKTLLAVTKSLGFQLSIAANPN